MAPCKIKRKGHRCGLGLCSDKSSKEECTLDYLMPPTKKVCKGPTTDTAFSLEKKICKKCGRLIKGHPLPRGRMCKLEPLTQCMDIQLEKRNLQLQKDRLRKKSDESKAKARERNKTEEAKYKARERNKSEEAKAKARERKKSEEAQAKARKRNKAEEAQAKARERNKSEEAKDKAKNRNKSKTAKEKSKVRSIASKKLKKKVKEYTGWTASSKKNSVKKHKLPNMSEICKSCGAKMFPWENSKVEERGKTFSLCCSYGAIRLNQFKDPSPKMKKLFDENSSQSKQFLKNIRQYNNLVSMSSKCITGKLTDFSRIRSKGPNIFKMSGQMYHLIPNLLPIEGEKCKFSQIYVYDNECEEKELDNRLKHVKENVKQNIDRATLKLIQKELKKINPYVKTFNATAKIFLNNPNKKLKMVIKAKGSIGAKKRVEKPLVQDVVVIAPGDQTEKRDVVL